MFDLVADIARYPEFLPWCGAARILQRSPAEGGAEVLIADLVIAFKVFRGAYTSRVTLDRAVMKIDVTHERGPFKHLRNHWRFLAEPDGSCCVDFFIDFEFDNFIIRKLMDVLFTEAVHRLVQAFEERAYAMYTPLKSANAISAK